MRLPDEQSPWRFLTALDGSRELDREIIRQTRSQELDLVNHMIMAGKTSILYAASGNGKTSLLNAGVIPNFVSLGYAVFRTRPRPPLSVSDPIRAFEQCMIEEQWLPDADSDSVSTLEQTRKELEQLASKDDSPLQGLLVQLEAHLERLQQTPSARAADFRAFMRAKSGSGSLVSFLKSVQSFLGSATRLLIICDQFEELFVHYWGTPTMYEYVSQIGDVVKAKDIKAQLLFSMREDWVGSMIEFRTVIPDVFACYYKLPPIKRTCALPALQLPLGTTQYRISDDVGNRILVDLSRCFPPPGQVTDAQRHGNRESPYIELPALQIVAEALWNTRDDRPEAFTAEHYQWLKSDSAVTGGQRHS